MWVTVLLKSGFSLPFYGKHEAGLQFDREKRREGKRLDIPAVQPFVFEPGETKRYNLLTLEETSYFGFNNKVNGFLD